ncbi:MAG: VCBS repeat-containing protein [Saprospiraceae bacterium]|nr:VCBS repeat-containing protein [Saprospiraceae bacterium]
MKSTIVYLLGMISFLFLISCSQKPDGEIDGPVFQLLEPGKTGISFSNTIVEDKQYNHLIWSHVYSGAGLGLGDINNDGLSDVFFAGNIVEDAIYLNKGDLQFEDITPTSGIVQDKGWSTGVTFGDVNQDGYDDIYVCRLGWTQNPNDRRNLLYINNGDNTFSERSMELGVNDGGFSIQATFFDMDRDGDLDLFVANQPPDPRLISRFKLKPEETKELYLDKLYRNNGKGQFEEVSEQYGVAGYGYGLNVVASDINGDGWTDLYVSNDYDSPDFLYINQKGKSFVNNINESIKHISNFAMGSDIADYDNDGLLDIAVVDMASADHIRSKTNMGSMRPDRFWKFVENGKHYQYMFNTLQKNNGNGSFSEIGQMAGISKTDWSWGIVMADFDNDSYKDVAITNGIQRDIRNNDFQYKIKKANESGQTQFNILDVVNLVPSTPISNFIFKNDGGLTFSEVTKDWGFDQPGFSHGMGYADLDNDGDLDLIINNQSSTAVVYKNTQANKENYIRFNLKGPKGNPHAYNAKVVIKYNGGTQVSEITSTRGYMSSSEPVAHFGLGDISEIQSAEIIWPYGKWTYLENPAINKVHEIDITKAGPRKSKEAPISPLFKESELVVHQHVENEFDDFAREILIPHKQSEHGPSIAAGDVNGDGLSDCFVGGAAESSGVLYLGQTGGGFSTASSQPWYSDRASEDLGTLFFDADADGDLDLYVVSGGSEFKPGNKLYQDRLYINNGAGTFSKGSLPAFAESGQAVLSNDVDADGDLDLFVSGRIVPGKYPSPANSYLLINEGGKFTDKTDELAPGFTGLGLASDAVFSDIDGDNDKDLLVVGEWMNIQVFLNTNGAFEDATENYDLGDSRGWWWTIEEGDFDGDGDPDFIVGNLGMNAKFKAKSDKPFMVYGNDFDNNGTNDVVLAKYYGDNVVPVRGRECSSEQMPFIADKFPTFEGFATASLDNILPEQKLDNAVQYKIKSFKSILLINEGGSFSKKYLPLETQVSPLRDAVVLDLNSDGHLDVVGAGNMYGAEVETMRYDAGIGFCLLGDGKGGFESLPVGESGFFAPHDARSIVSIQQDGKLVLLVANNNEKVQSFTLDKPSM